jgi:putative membrane protein
LASTNDKRVGATSNLLVDLIQMEPIMLKRCLLITCFTAAVSLVPAFADAQTRSQPAGANQPTSKQATKTDQRFLTEAIQGDVAEVNMGKLAQQKGQGDDVKQYGQMLQQDHGEHLQKAQQMAQQLGVTPPNSPNTKQQETYAKLEKLSGAAFDREFKQAMVKDHAEDIAKYKKEARSKGPLAEFAQQTVPTLEKHLQHAQALGRRAPTTGSR